MESRLKKRSKHHQNSNIKRRSATQTPQRSSCLLFKVFKYATAEAWAVLSVTLFVAGSRHTKKSDPVSHISAIQPHVRPAPVTLAGRTGVAARCLVPLSHGWGMWVAADAGYLYPLVAMRGRDAGRDRRSVCPPAAASSCRSATSRRRHTESRRGPWVMGMVGRAAPPTTPLSEYLLLLLLLAATSIGKYFI